MGWIPNIITKLFSIKATGLAANPRLFKDSAAKDVDNYIRNIAGKRMNQAVVEARRNAPVKTGRLRGSIYALSTQVTGSVVQVAIASDVIYARRQEYEHPTKAFFMLRGLQSVVPALKSDLENVSDLTDIILRLKTSTKFTNQLLINPDTE